MFPMTGIGGGMASPFTLRVAVLIAAHNRRDSTVRALELLLRSAPAHWQLRIYLTDDGSVDGTAQAAQSLAADVTVVSGPGDWFWSRSMREAERAVDRPCDAYLWMNDDVRLYPDTLARLDALHQTRPDCILVGQFEDPETGAWTYGGHRRKGRYPIGRRPVLAASEPAEVDLIHGNLMLVPLAVARAVGPIDGHFTHGFADFDYGLRARRAGYSSLAMPGFAGTTRSNPLRRPAPSIRESVTLYESRLGFPLRDRVRFMRRHGGWAWPLHVATPYLALLVGYRPRVREANVGSSADQLTR